MDRDTPLLLPPDLRQWVRGTGSHQFPPRMMLSLTIHCYATGTFSSRAIERATHTDVAVRFLTGDSHPDHDTICEFRRQTQPVLAESFVRVLEMAQECKLLKFGQLTLAADGTKILANASKHSAVSYPRAGEQIELLRQEVDQLLAKAVPAPVRAQVRAVLADTGFYSAAAVAAAEANGGPTGYAAVEKTGHHRSVSDLEQRADPSPPAAEADAVEQMRYRLRTKAGRALDRLRQQTVEPVFGIIKEALGLRRFSLRGQAGDDLEWTLVCLAYNLRRLHRLSVVAG